MALQEIPSRRQDHLSALRLKLLPVNSTDMSWDAAYSFLKDINGVIPNQHRRQAAVLLFEVNRQEMSGNPASILFHDHSHLEEVCDEINRIHEKIGVKSLTPWDVQNSFFTVALYIENFKREIPPNDYQALSDIATHSSSDSDFEEEVQKRWISINLFGK